ncbi:hypothetical protein DERP_007967, partial [Dermatophagoides pteronyssinus]
MCYAAKELSKCLLFKKIRRNDQILFAQKSNRSSKSQIQKRHAFVNILIYNLIIKCTNSSLSISCFIT